MNETISKADEILKNWENSTDHYADQEYSKERVIEAMKEYAKWCCEQQREMILERFKKYCKLVSVIPDGYYEIIKNTEIFKEE